MDNTLGSIFGSDLGNIFSDVGNKVAKSKGYDDLYSLAIGSASSEIMRQVDKPGGDTKQTPAVIQPGEWSQQISKSLPFEVKLSNTQLALAGLVAVGVIYLIIKR